MTQVNFFFIFKFYLGFKKFIINIKFSDSRKLIYQLLKLAISDTFDDDDLTDLDDDPDFSLDEVAQIYGNPENLKYYFGRKFEEKKEYSIQSADPTRKVTLIFGNFRSGYVF